MEPRHPVSRASLGVALLLALLATPAAEALSRHERTRIATQQAPLILVSVDGFRADYLDRGITPNLARLARRGARARALIPSFPTLTFPNHYTLVTGLTPDHHGIVGNRMRDPLLGSFSMSRRESVQDGRWWGGEPIWVTLERAGRKTAPVFWPGSEAEIRGIRPSIWKPFDGTLAPEQRVDELLARLDLPADQRPAFLTLYFEMVDDAGHEHGPVAPGTDAAIAHADRMIGRLVAGLAARGLEREVRLVVVSDHGMAAIRPDGAILLDDFVDPATIDLIYASGVAHIAPLAGHGAEVLGALLGPHPHMTCYAPGTFPPAWRYGENPRVPPVTCQAEVGYKIGTREWFAAHPDEPRGGAHGFAPEEPSMRAILIAAGPGVARHRLLPELSNVHVAALIAALTGVEAPASDARRAAIEPFLARPLR